MRVQIPPAAPKSDYADYRNNSGLGQMLGLGLVIFYLTQPLRYV